MGIYECRHHIYVESSSGSDTENDMSTTCNTFHNGITSYIINIMYTCQYM